LSKCTAITRGGTRCQGVAIDSSGLCYSHHPDKAEARRRRASKGGRRGGRGRSVAELASLRDENHDIRHRLLEGELLPGVAAVAIQSLNCDIRAVATTLKAKEQEELVERLESLEEALEHQRKTRRHGI
jgi:hypothetical protein